MKTIEDKQLLIKQLKKTPIIQVVCEKTGVARATYYRWMKTDEKFAEAAYEAIEQSSALINDLAESQLIAAIRDKNMTAIVWWLKHHHPKYAARIELDAHIHHDKQELTPEQAQVVAQALKLGDLLKLPEGENSNEN